MGGLCLGIAPLSGKNDFKLENREDQLAIGDVQARTYDENIWRR